MSVSLRERDIRLTTPASTPHLHHPHLHHPLIVFIFGKKKKRKEK